MLKSKGKIWRLDWNSKWSGHIVAGRLHLHELVHDDSHAQIYNEPVRFQCEPIDKLKSLVLWVL